MSHFTDLQQSLDQQSAQLRRRFLIKKIPRMEQTDWSEFTIIVQSGVHA